MEYTALELMDKLIACWNSWDSHEDYYLTDLAPSIMRSDGSVKLTDDEKDIVPGLRRLLSEEEWLQLPSLIAQRRCNKLKELASDRERAKAQGEARRREEERVRRKEERKQREIEQQELERRLAEESRIMRKQALIAKLEHLFESDFLSADGALSADSDAELVSSDEYDKLKMHFVRDWAARELRQPLDLEQAAAIAATRGDIKVVARAGSGKTRTLVTRAIFLQKHCRVSPRSILLLAFNKKAAEEMRGRLARTLGMDLPHVMTFHALAYAFVHPEEEILFDDTSTDQLGLSREIQEVIDEHIRSEEYRNHIRDVMLAHFREDWERIVDGRFHLTMDEFLAHRHALPRESLNGDYVKSYGEKVIANALFEHGVEYRYERNFRWNGINYRPDFTVLSGPKGGIIIEYFGRKGDADYDKMSEKKRAFWSKRNEWTFLEFSPRDLAQNEESAFVDMLLRELRKAGVSYRRRSEEEIWELVRGRAVDGFTKAMKAFVSRCRKGNLSRNDLESMVASHRPCSTAEGLFLRIGISIYRGYLQRLATWNKQDFDGLMWKAVSLVRRGHTSFLRDKGKERGDVAHMRFVMIDEFQDFSAMFFELVDAVRSVNPGVQFFCVGDDWQAINRFAGADLRFFTDFDEYFINTSLCYIRTNHRSPKSVVAVGNALMHGQGLGSETERGDSGQTWLCRLDEFSPVASEQERHNGDEITPAVLRLLRRFLDSGLDVVMLSRRNGLPWYVSYAEATRMLPDALLHFREHICSFLPEEDHERVRVSTTHGYKGLEDSAVIVLDAVKRSYPLVHPNWVFLRVFGDRIGDIEAEERRLFYVAITRAKDSLAILTQKLAESPYLDDIQRQVRLDLLPWSDLPPAPSLDGPRLEIRVFNAYNVRDQLKDLKYRWNDLGQYWSKAAPAEGFSMAALLNQSWAAGEVRIEVYSEMGELLHRT